MLWLLGIALSKAIPMNTQKLCFYITIHENCLTGVILMSSQTVCFHAELKGLATTGKFSASFPALHAISKKALLWKQFFSCRVDRPLAEVR